MEILNTLNPYTKLFLGLLSIKVLLQNYLDLRQKKSLSKNFNQVPDIFGNLISLEEHQKATEYNLEKIFFSKFVRSFRLIILLLWTIGGGLSALSYYIIKSDESFSQIGIFFISYLLIETILSIPASYYSTFVIEQKYGFNKTTKKTFIVDILKSILLSIAIGLPLFLFILYLLEVMGESWWLYSWVAFVIFQLLLVFIYPKFIAPIFNKFSEITDDSLVEEIKILLNKTNFNAKGLFKMDASKRSSHGNAYFTGFGKNKRIVFFDTLLNQMNTKEILAILAHELGHFKKKHVLKSMIFAFLMMILMFFILSKAISSSAFLEGHGLQTNSSAVSIILFMMILPVYTFLITPIGNIISRKNEFEADNFACHHTSSEDLQSALLKLYKFNYGALCPDEIYSNFYDSHPPALIRIKNLKKNIKKKTLE